MTVRELIELNQHIVDADIEIRKDGGLLLDALLIGPSVGEIPPFPRKIPESANFAANPTRARQANYKQKSINAWDDGKDYWQVKPDRIPKAWQELTVFSWEVWPASVLGSSKRRMTEGSRNVNFHGQRINIVALPSGEIMAIPEEKRESKNEPDNQLNIFDYMEVDDD